MSAEAATAPRVNCGCGPTSDVPDLAALDNRERETLFVEALR